MREPRTAPILCAVTRRRLVQLCVLVALMLAPFGRIGVAQAMPMPHQESMMAAHCAGQPMPDPDKSHRMAVDCMIACAAMAPAVAPFLLPAPAPMAVPEAAIASHLTGIRPEADPPPPRPS